MHILKTIALAAIFKTGYAQPITSTPALLTISALENIAPASSTCAGALYPLECRTATQALPFILASFAKYSITHPSVQAALISLMAFESGDFKYNKNHYPAPGRPGQGTRNMQSPALNALYAASLGLPSTGTPETVAEEVEADEYTFGSAAWFVVSQCPLAVRERMWSGEKQGWEDYLTGCVGTSVEEGRVEYWERALAALGSG